MENREKAVYSVLIVEKEPTLINRLVGPVAHSYSGRVAVLSCESSSGHHALVLCEAPDLPRMLKSPGKSFSRFALTPV